MLLNRREDEISDYHTPWGESHPVYDIEPDAQVEIKVTAQDGVTDSVYRVVVYSRPVEQANQGSGEKLDSVSTGIPHFGDLWLQDADDNYYKTDFDTTYQMSKGGVHKLNLKASVHAGVNLFVGYKWRQTASTMAATVYGPFTATGAYRHALYVYCSHSRALCAISHSRNNALCSGIPTRLLLLEC